MIDFDDALYRLTPGYIKRGGHYTGSYDGKRFLIELQKQEEADDRIHVCIWPEPLCYEKTDDQLKHQEYFEFSDKGLEDAWKYVQSIVKAAG
jgi:hypothetical protein